MGSFSRLRWSGIVSADICSSSLTPAGALRPGAGVDHIDYHKYHLADGDVLISIRHPPAVCVKYITGEVVYNMGSMNAERILVDKQYYRFVTAMFLHADIELVDLYQKSFACAVLYFPIS